MTLLLIIPALTCGLLLLVVAAGKSGRLRLDWTSLFEIVISGICITSLVSIVLLELERFNIVYLIILLTVLAVILAAAAAPLRRNLTVKFSFGLDRIGLALLIILAVAAFLRYPPSNWVAGGQDQGIYVNVGNNIARTGKIFIKDSVLETIGPNEELREIYLKNNYNWFKTVFKDRYEGGFQLGFYIKDVEEGIWVPQFYHLHPLWFAISKSLLGEEKTTYPLFAFSLLNIIAIYLFAAAVFRSRCVGLVSALMLAVNPLHTFMSKFPLSEVTASMFLFSALYFLVSSRSSDRHKLSLSVLSFGCLFFTRITGFLFLPPLVFYLFYLWVFERSAAKRRNVLYFTIGVFAMYLYSLVHAAVYALPYSHQIYTLNVGLKAVKAYLVAMPVLCIALAAVALFFKTRFRMAWYHLARNGKILAASFITVMLSYILYKYYTVAFAHEFAEEVIIDRWAVVDSGMDAYHRFNLVVLGKLLTPVGLILFFGGFYLLLTKVFYNRNLLLFTLFTTVFFLVYIISKYKTPFLYYYARYLVSELLPIMVITIAFAAVGFSGIFRRAATQKAVLSALIAVMVLPSLYYSYHISKATELDGFYEAIKDIDDGLGEKSIVFVNKHRFPTFRQMYTTPLRLTFDRGVFEFDSEEFGADGLREAALFFLRKGYDPYVLTAKNAALDYHYLELVKEVVVPHLQMENNRPWPTSHGKVTKVLWLPRKYGLTQFSYQLFTTNYALYRWSTVVHFGLSGNGANYISNGWSSPEKGFIWTDGNEAELSFLLEALPKGPVVLKMNLRALVHPGKHDRQRVRILVNGQEAGGFVVTEPGFSERTISIEQDLFTDIDNTVITFAVPDAVSPNELGLSEDRRTLAVALRSIELVPGPGVTTSPEG